MKTHSPVKELQVVSQFPRRAVTLLAGAFRRRPGGIVEKNGRLSTHLASACWVFTEVQGTVFEA